MRKKHLLLSVIIAALLPVSPMASAVEFGPNSAKITNQYYPVKVGDWSYMLGVGDDWAGKVTYTTVVGIEEISGAQIAAQTFNNVKCLKVNMIRTEIDEKAEFITLWMAQDTEGNVWILKIYIYFDDDTYLLGTLFKSMFMPAAPVVGDPASIIIPENSSTYCRVVETGITIDSNYGRYNSCIKTDCLYNSSIESSDYFCPDVGMVKYTEVEDPKGFMDLKELGTATVTRAVVISLMD
jgi:hypothetical protein